MKASCSSVSQTSSGITMKNQSHRHRLAMPYHQISLYSRHTRAQHCSSLCQSPPHKKKEPTNFHPINPPPPYFICTQPTSYISIWLSHAEISLNSKTPSFLCVPSAKVRKLHLQTYLSHAPPAMTSPHSFALAPSIQLRIYPVCLLLLLLLLLLLRTRLQWLCWNSQAGPAVLWMGPAKARLSLRSSQGMMCIGLARTIHIWHMYGNFGRKIAKFTVCIYIWFWATLLTSHLRKPHVSNVQKW